MPASSHPHKSRLTHARVRVEGLDTIRFFAAMWVVWGHFGPIPLTAGLDRSHFLGWLTIGLYNNFFSGPAAVIVFFVISGFCIHFPFANGGAFRLGPFLFRRYSRIAIPMGTAILLAHSMGVELRLFERTILWSLVAELIYYTLYPAIRLALTRTSLRAILALAYTASVAAILTQPGAGDYPSYGWQMNWLLGLPCWLLGVRLAELFTEGNESPVPRPSRSGIWIWRIGIWVLSIACSILRFHSPIGYPWSLNLFAIAVYFWLAREIVWHQAEHPSRLLEWSGTWSYSIYLVHGLGNQVYYLVFFYLLSYLSDHGVPDPGNYARWIVQMTIILAFCYAFYLLIERPAHHFARIGAAWLARHPGLVSGREALIGRSRD